METQLESVVAINEFQLDKECIRLPTDYLQWAHKAADARRDVDEAKSALEVVESDLSAEIRATPEDFDIKNVTEKAIAAAIKSNPRYQKAQRRFAKAKHEQDLTQSVVSAFEHKKRSLSLLVELHGLGYRSSPTYSRKGKEAVERTVRKRKARRSTEDDE